MSRRAFTLVECVIAVVITAGMLAAALAAVGMARQGELMLTDRVRGDALAQDLLAEILARPYADPDGAAKLGPDSNETSRKDYDDVDDYAAVVKQAPADADGKAFAGYGDWLVTVEVTWVSRVDPALTTATETDFKRVRVRIWRGAREVSVVDAYRARAWPTQSYVGAGA